MKKSIIYLFLGPRFSLTEGERQNINTNLTPMIIIRDKTDSLNVWKERPIYTVTH